MDLKNRSRQVLWSMPAVHKALMRKKWGDSFEPSSFECYVCGFPRSGNNFMKQVLQSCCFFEEKAISGASHLPPYISESIARGLPTFLTIRNPSGSVASWVTATGCSVQHALDYYLLFHAKICALNLEQILVCDFDEMTSLSERFRVDLDRYLPDLKSKRVWLSSSQVLSELRAGNGSAESLINTAPTEKKKAINQKIKEELKEEQYERKLEKCRKIHASILGK